VWDDDVVIGVSSGGREGGGSEGAQRLILLLELELLSPRDDDIGLEMSLHELCRLISRQDTARVLGSRGQVGRGDHLLSHSCPIDLSEPFMRANGSRASSTAKTTKRLWAQETREEGFDRWGEVSKF
jgi:hypothetical protein